MISQYRFSELLQKTAKTWNIKTIRYKFLNFMGADNLCSNAFLQSIVKIIYTSEALLLTYLIGYLNT